MIDGLLQLELPAGPTAWAAGAPLPAFVVGPENQLLVPALQRLLDAGDLAAAASLFNPLVLVGPSGSGKSHLAQGLVRRWQLSANAPQISYFSAADFTRECRSAMADGRLAAWRSQLRTGQLLVVENIEDFRRGSAAQLEFRQAIDAVMDRGGLIIATANCEPAAMASLDAGVRDRLAAGLTVRIGKPGPAARRSILAHAAAARGIAVDENQLDRLSQAEAPAVAALLDRLAAVAPPMPSAGQPDSRAAAQTQVTVKQILAVVARYFAVTQSSLVGPSRRRSLVTARNAVVYLARRLTALSYAEIGRDLGGRDHSTIMHAQRRIAQSLAEDPNLQQAVDELDRILRC